MKAEEYKQCVAELMTIPCIKRQVADDLIVMGIKKVSDLKNKNPTRLHQSYMKQFSGKADKSLIYMLQCAVYFASNTRHDKEKLNLQYWKDHS